MKKVDLLIIVLSFIAGVWFFEKLNQTTPNEPKQGQIHLDKHKVEEFLKGFNK